MKRHRLYAALIAAVTAVPMALAACATEPAAERTTIRVWVVGQDTPQQARDYLKTTFEQEHEGATLIVEEQSWTDLVEHLKSSIDGSRSPDVVEVGNTQAPALTSGGYLRALTDEQFLELGGSDLLQEFVTIGDWEDVHYAVPYYASVRVVFYSPQLVPDLQVPTTLDQYTELARSLTTDEVSGVYWPGQDWYNALPFVWENGGYIAEKAEDGTWEAGFSSPGGLAGLHQVQDLLLEASHAGRDEAEKDLQVPFCAGRVAMISSVPSFQSAVQDISSTSSCVEGLGGDLTAFALPSKDGGGPAQVFGGGSNLGISANSPNPDLAFDALNIMLGSKYQSILGSHNLAPAKVSLAATVPQGNPIARAGAEAATHARLTPATPRWAEVESQTIMQTAMTRIAQGEEVETVATELDAQIEKILNG